MRCSLNTGPTVRTRWWGRWSPSAPVGTALVVALTSVRNATPGRIFGSGFVLIADDD
ncbi:MAG: hypothetical protein OEW42_09030 [Acidimicrobiia bacterium]|nr:hypothetical protein [Acidimicrobiia bacterium]MDH5238256.1 hypothetical protein [Acidimicrobiia bacterium]